MPMNPWHVETNALRLRRFGKLGEELGELQAVVSRCIIQGIDAVDPATNKTNRERLEDEMADVQAQLGCCIADLQLDRKKMVDRMHKKMLQMAEWEHMLRQEKEV